MGPLLREETATLDTKDWEPLDTRSYEQNSEMGGKGVREAGQK